MNQLIEFLRLVQTPSSVIQIGTLQQVVCVKPEFASVSVQQNSKNDLYFLGGVSPEKGNNRASDDDIVEKSYVAFDFDIRKNLGDCDDTTLTVAIKLVLDALKSTETFGNYGAAVCSGNGLHVYYFCEIPLQLRDKKVKYSIGYEHACTAIEAIIRTYFVFNNIDMPVFCPDRACKNTGRIMRVPTSWNHKNGKSLPVTFIEMTGKYSSVPYDILDSGSEPANNSTQGKESFGSFYKPKLTTDTDTLTGLTLWEQLRLLDNRMMLEKLSGTPLVNGERYTFERRGGAGGWVIKLNNQPINAWIDPDGYIGSPGIHGRTWVEWVMNWPDFKKSAKEVVGWVHENLDLPSAVKGKFLRVSLITPSQMFESSESVFSSYRGRFTWFTPELDDAMPVFMPGDYALVVGEAAIGKTTMALHFAIENAKRGRKVVYFSLEQTPRQLLENYAAQVVGVTEEIQKRDAVTTEHNRLAHGIFQSMPKTFKFPKLPSAATELTIEDIINTIRLNTEVELVVIDNLGFLKSPDQDEEWKELQELNRALVRIAHDNERPVGVFALHHFKKGMANATGPRGNDDIRGSKKLIDDSDLVIQITKETFDDTKHTPEQKDYIFRKRTMHVTKDRRHGRSRSVDYYLANGKIVDDYEAVKLTSINF